MASIIQNPILWAVIGGALPTLLWVWYFNSRTEHRESRSILVFAFTAGIIAFWVTLPVQRYIIDAYSISDQNTIFLLACVEEMIKFFILRALVLRVQDIQYRSDYVLHMTTAALGFAAMENTMYLLNPLSIGNYTAAFMTGNLRFFGSTIVHSVSSALHGLWVGLALGGSIVIRWTYWLFGLLSATLVHGVFNTYVGTTNSLHSVLLFLGLWMLLALISMLFHKSEVEFE